MNASHKSRVNPCLKDNNILIRSLYFSPDSHWRCATLSTQRKLRSAIRQTAPYPQTITGSYKSVRQTVIPILSGRVCRRHFLQDARIWTTPCQPGLQRAFLLLNALPHPHIGHTHSVDKAQGQLLDTLPMMMLNPNAFPPFARFTEKKCNYFNLIAATST